MIASKESSSDMSSFEARLTELDWRKASMCQSGECVEVAQQDGMIVLRSSKDPDSILSYTAMEWQSFLRGIKAGEFDDHR